MTSTAESCVSAGEILRSPSVEPGLQRNVLRNAIASYFGRILSAVLNVVFLPVYLHILGTEAYGVVGIFTAIQSVTLLLDLGLSTTLSKELARLFALPDGKRECADLVRTFETVYWFVGLAIAVVLCLSAPFIAARWLHAATVSNSALTKALVLMGAVIGIAWPVGLYSGGFLGLERHVHLNLISGGFSLLRFGGAALLLWAVHGGIVCYFLWQLAVSAAFVLSLRSVFWRGIAVRGRGRFRSSVLRTRISLIAGIGGSYGVMVLLNNADKFALSKLVSLETFSYYTVAWAAMGVFYFFYGPISAAFYPRIVRLCGLSLNSDAMREYELGSQITALLVFPTAAVLSLFSAEVMSLWISNRETVAHTHLLLRYLAPALALSSFVSLSNMLQWAHDWTSVGLYANAGALIVLVPAVFAGASRGGVLWAAIACAGVRGLHALVQLEITHRRFFPLRKWIWYREVAITAAVAVVAVFTGKHLLPSTCNRIEMALGITAIWSVSVVAGAVASPSIRAHAEAFLARVSLLHPQIPARS